MIQITNDDLRAYLPSTVQVQASIYERLQPAVIAAERSIHFNSLGDVGLHAIEDAFDATLLASYKRWVALTAFLNVLHQNDVALTTAGFAVMQSNNQAPASKHRIDALRHELQQEIFRERIFVTSRIRSAQYADTIFAVREFPTLIDLQTHCNIHPDDSPQQAMEAQKEYSIYQAQLAQHISQQMLDTLLYAYRAADNKYYVITSLIQQWLIECREGHKEIARGQLRQIINILQSDAILYAPYHSSAQYEAIKTANYKNDRNATSYIF